MLATKCSYLLINHPRIYKCNKAEEMFKGSHAVWTMPLSGSRTTIAEPAREAEVVYS